MGGISKVMKNGVKILDTSGNVLHAHGGWMLKQNGYYYWFGENRTEDIRVSCYRSKDFVTWEHRNDVLTLNSRVGDHYIRRETALVRKLTPSGSTGSKMIGCNIERPKVLYNECTKKYVMWMHYENGLHYGDARCAVAICDTIDGDYTYLGSFNPIGNMSRDCTVFVDDDQTAYFISAARENADLIIYRLTEDYLAIEEQIKVLWPGQCREAPVIFKRHGIYYMLTSACTGWAPNQGQYATCDSLTGHWSKLRNFGDETTYASQPAFVVTLSDEKDQFLYIGDRWNGENYPESTYVFLPLKFDQDGNLFMGYGEETVVDLENDRIVMNETKFK